MKKNWLIRTKNNHILGPISRDKIKELIDNGSIKGDDEVCSGNGFWLFVREQELVEKYVNLGEKQPYNPVQEATPRDIVAFADSIDAGEDHEVKLPSSEDLEYPDLEAENIDSTSDDITRFEISRDQLNTSDEIDDE